MPAGILKFLILHGGDALSKTVWIMGSCWSLIKKSDYEEFLKQKKKQLWLCLPLKVFRFDEVELYGVYCCPECESMAGIPGLATHQAPDVIRDRL